MSKLKEVQNPGLVKPETRDQIAARNREAAKGLWAGKLTAAELAGVNAVCEAYGLDPLLKHILVLGGNLYITVAGLRTWAYKQEDKPISIQVVPVTPEEKKAAGCPDTAHYWKALVWKADTPPDKPFTEFGESDKDNVSLHRAGWKEIQDMAKTRAVGRALRNAYPVSLPLAEDMPMFPWDGAIETTATTTVEAPPPPGSLGGGLNPLEQAISHLGTIEAIPHLSNYWNANAKERESWTKEEQTRFKIAFDARMTELRDLAKSGKML